MVPIHEYSAVALGRMIAAGDLDAVEVTRWYLNRIGVSPERDRAWMTVTADHALDEAARLRGEQRSAPLDGVPIALKDLSTTRGIRTTYGSRLLRDHVPEYDDSVISRVHRGGMPILGKTTTPEFGISAYTESLVAPPAQTPWQPGRTSGGSSGGAAVAVATGMAPIALGSDGGGSIRIPAACCGIVGFKPSRGRVSAGPGYGDVLGLATAGPLARTVEDAAALLDVIAGPEPGDPFWAAPEPEGFLAAARREPGRLRIARFDQPIMIDTALDPAQAWAYDRASQLLQDLGHEVIDIPAPLGPEIAPSFSLAWAALAAAQPVPGDPAELLPMTRWQRDQAAGSSAAELAAAMVELRQHAARALRALADYDAVLTPALAQRPPKIGAMRDDEEPAADFEAQKRFTPFTAAWNVTGMPAVSLPIARDEEGIPLSAMLAAAPGRDAALLSLAAQVERTVGSASWWPPE